MTLRMGGWLVLTIMVLGIGVAGVYYYKITPVLPEVATQEKGTLLSPEEVRTRWEEGVKLALATYDQDRKAEAARDALIVLRVATNDKELHLKLVQSFQLLVDGVPGAQASYEAARVASDARLSSSTP